jgi:hypothetical protein
MKNTQEHLASLVTQHPELPVILLVSPRFDEYFDGDDNSFAAGSIGESFISKYCTVSDDNGTQKTFIEQLMEQPEIEVLNNKDVEWYTAIFTYVGKMNNTDLRIPFNQN